MFKLIIATTQGVQIVDGKSNYCRNMFTEHKNKALEQGPINSTTMGIVAMYLYDHTGFLVLMYQNEKFDIYK